MRKDEVGVSSMMLGNMRKMQNVFLKIRTEDVGLCTWACSYGEWMKWIKKVYDSCNLVWLGKFVCCSIINKLPVSYCGSNTNDWAGDCYCEGTKYYHGGTLTWSLCRVYYDNMLKKMCPRLSGMFSHDFEDETRHWEKRTSLCAFILCRKHQIPKLCRIKRLKTEKHGKHRLYLTTRFHVF